MQLFSSIGGAATSAAGASGDFLSQLIQGKGVGNAAGAFGLQDGAGKDMLNMIKTNTKPITNSQPPGVTQPGFMDFMSLFS